MDSVRVAVVGVSGRGRGLLGLLLGMPDVEVIGVSDLYEDRLARAKQDVIEKRGNTPMASTDFRRLLEMKELDAVITPSSWTSHADVCIASMDAGKYAATEVGGATSVEQCWELVRTSERTKKPCMLLENCCYGREELTIFNMVKQGLFGELVHAEGGYQHDLRDEICNGRENRHYRLANYSNRNGEVYPTHELGPIAKCLNINRGNRMLTLTATASKARGLHEWVKTHRGEEYDLFNRQFTMGDVVTTVIKCAHGETITLTHDTSLPRPYSRGNRIEGTKGIWMEDKYAVYLEGVSPKADVWDSLNNYYEKYEHPLWKWYRTEGVKGGHGGMDYLVLRAYVEAVKAGTQTPIDVYDTAAWMAVTCLSEDSVAMGSMPVAIPDFTNGKWFQREPAVLGKYCLTEVCDC
ncbi:MAG: Gfo/Idh/MocA family oxidoreductase [Victivallales bacterium]|nr:Gfo/Idh/MocA family oxidoreductase [Victivallales bacterium]MBR5078070.1 Gfo/Idh/MocA family oxidoreductase [Victivallales bacterium]